MGKRKGGDADASKLRSKDTTRVCSAEEAPNTTFLVSVLDRVQKDEHEGTHVAVASTAHMVICST